MRLLSFLFNELKQINYYNKIELLVSNNCSTDNTEEVILTSDLYNLNIVKFIYLKNTENFGPIFNIIKLIRKSQGEYVWILGDDDVYYSGIISKVFEEIQKRKYSYIFINHCTYKNYKGDGTGLNSVIGEVAICSENKEILLDIFQYSGGSLMFISAAIHKKETIIEYLNKNETNNLALPLMLSFYSASNGKVKIIPEIMIENVQNEISWREQLFQVFLYDIPYVLSKLQEMRYNKIRSFKVLLDYFWKQKKGYKYYFLNKLKEFLNHYCPVKI
jgi:glycosyltransferase involved in cell wall biosynthesis